MNIVEAIFDPHLFRPFLADKTGSIASWSAWFTALKVLYGLPLSPGDAQLVQTCTGRSIDKLPRDGFSQALLLCGRRSGKSRIAATIAGFESCLSGREKVLAKGEIPLVAAISPTKLQSKVVTSYLRALFQTPLLAAELVEEQKESFTLRNGVRVQILCGDYRSVRGFTLLSAVIDEAAYFGLSEESKVRSDSELIRALLPGLVTASGRLTVISTPYARKGWCYQTHKKHFGNNDGTTLVWNCPSRTMNPLLPESVVTEALEEDLQAAKSEYLGEFRDDIALFLPRELIEAVVIRGRIELLARENVTYSGFVDVSGGRSDSASVAICHKQDGKVILDLLREYKPPFDPARVIEGISEELKRYDVKRTYGDSYAAEFTVATFRRCGVAYEKSNKSKSQIYLETIPIICSRAVELLDNEALITQFSNLVRKTRSGGADVVDHPAGQGFHDDLSNAVSGAVVYCNRPKVFAGGWPLHRNNEAIFT